MLKWKRLLLLGSLGVTLLAGLLFTSATSGLPTALANCNSTATGSYPNWQNNCQVSEGNISNMVYAIQQSIDDSGTKNVHTGAKCYATEDGDFGQITFDNVECYQGAKPPLSVDGIVGPQTWKSFQSILVFVKNDGTFSYYRGPHSSLDWDFVKTDSNGVWLVWVTSDSEWCTINLSARC